MRSLLFLMGWMGRPLAEPKHLRFTTGVRKKAWIKNCIAIGLTGGFLEPLESTSIHLTQRAIHKLLSMFPTNNWDQRLIDKYNQQMYREYDEVKDFLIAHYHITEREDTPFWRYVKNMDIPDSLKNKLETFKSRGEIVVDKDDLFRESSWFAVLMGQGLEPNCYHPIADAISDEQLEIRMSRIREAVKKRVALLPEHGEFIKKLYSINHKK